jgi:hypothetical protein
MKTDYRRFDDLEDSRAYIRNLADRFEDPERMALFLKECDIALAALVDCMLKESKYQSLQLYYYKKGIYAENKSAAEISDAWNEYLKASTAFQQSRVKLKNTISESDVQC